MAIAQTKSTPYFAVIFTSIRTDGDNGYAAMAEAMADSAARQPGFLGIESAREELGITVCYWESLESIEAWKRDAAHLIAQSLGASNGTRLIRPAFAELSAITNFR